MNPQKVAMCANISQTTFPPKPATQPERTPAPWAAVHASFLPSMSASRAHRTHLLSKAAH
eukprot:69899-Prymnesium_polylepis.2